MNPKRSRYYTYIRPVIKNKAVRTYSSLIFSIITITIFLIYAIRPTVSTILSLQKSINEQKQIYETLNKKVADLTEGRKNYEAIDPELKTRLVDLIPYSPSIPALINSLNSLAKVSDASLSGIQFQSTELRQIPKTLDKNVSLQEIDFTFNAAGGYRELLTLLVNLRKSDRLINIQTITFNKPADGSLIMTVNGKSLFIKNK